MPHRPLVSRRFERALPRLAVACPPPHRVLFVNVASIAIAFSLSACDEEARRAAASALQLDPLQRLFAAAGGRYGDG